jgi:hypothetical protein
MSCHCDRLDDSQACVKLLNVHIPAMLVASNIHNHRVFPDIAERRTAFLIRVCVANSHGLALASIGLTLRSVIVMLTPMRF